MNNKTIAGIFFRIWFDWRNNYCRHDKPGCMVVFVLSGILDAGLI